MCCTNKRHVSRANVVKLNSIEETSAAFTTWRVRVQGKSMRGCTGERTGAYETGVKEAYGLAAYFAKKQADTEPFSATNTPSENKEQLASGVRRVYSNARSKAIVAMIPKNRDALTLAKITDIYTRKTRNISVSNWPLLENIHRHFCFVPRGPF